ncbi:MAG: hypothetical protein ACK559_36840, partial [bacterium]
MEEGRQHDAPGLGGVVPAVEGEREEGPELVHLFAVGGDDLAQHPGLQPLELGAHGGLVAGVGPDAVQQAPLPVDEVHLHHMRGGVRGPRGVGQGRGGGRRGRRQRDAVAVHAPGHRAEAELVGGEQRGGPDAACGRAGRQRVGVAPPDEAGQVFDEAGRGLGPEHLPTHGGPVVALGQLEVREGRAEHHLFGHGAQVAAGGPVDRDQLRHRLEGHVGRRRAAEPARHPPRGAGGEARIGGDRVAQPHLLALQAPVARRAEARTFDRGPQRGDPRVHRVTERAEGLRAAPRVGQQDAGAADPAHPGPEVRRQGIEGLVAGDAAGVGAHGLGDRLVVGEVEAAGERDVPAG